MNKIDDPTLLKVKGESSFDGISEQNKDSQRKEYIKKLSSAILIVIEKHGHATLKAVGQAALGNAIKSIIVAKTELYKNGIFLKIDPSFGDADFDGNIKTAYLLKVENSKGLKDE